LDKGAKLDKSDINQLISDNSKTVQTLVAIDAADQKLSKLKGAPAPLPTQPVSGDSHSPPLHWSSKRRVGKRLLSRPLQY
jgi:hypothetical protein